MSEIIEFSKWRRKQLFESDTKSKIESEMKYGKYCCLHLDIPYFKNDNLVDWFNENSKPIKKIESDVADSLTDVSVFSSIDVILEDRESSWDNIWTKNTHRNFQNEFPLVYQSFYDALPFKKIYRFSLWSSTGSIIMHRDQSSFLDMPSSFRIMLHDNNPSSTLYLGEYLPDQEMPQGKYYNIPRLESTNSFVWNNLRTKHGSKYEANHKKILIIFQDVDMDWQKYTDLLDRSISKYGNFAMTSDNKITNFIKD